MPGDAEFLEHFALIAHECDMHPSLSGTAQFPLGSNVAAQHIITAVQFTLTYQGAEQVVGSSLQPFFALLPGITVLQLLHHSIPATGDYAGALCMVQKLLLDLLTVLPGIHERLCSIDLPVELSRCFPGRCISVDITSKRFRTWLG